MKNNSILVTGYLGMIGKKIYSLLRNKTRYVVHGIDIKNSTGDVRNYKSTRKYDYIIHCAALTSVTESMKYPDKYYDYNTNGTEHMLKSFPDSKFIFLSTSGIYGEGLKHKETDPLLPESPYAKSKLLAENAIQKIADNWAILRLGNVVGGKKGERNVYQCFEEDKIITIYGDGKQTRDFIKVEEVCTSIVRSFKVNGIYNIGTGYSKTILDVAKEFDKPIRFLPSRRGEINQFGLDVSKARKAGLL